MNAYRKIEPLLNVFNNKTIIVCYACQKVKFIKCLIMLRNGFKMCFDLFGMQI